MKSSDSPVTGLIYLVVAVAVIGGIVRALRWAWKKLLFAFGWTKGAAQTLALAGLALLAGLLLWGLLELAAGQLARSLRQRRSRLACPLPRLESVRQGHSTHSALDEWMRRLLCERAAQVYGVDASSLSEGDFQHLRVRLLPMIWSDRGFRIWFESQVISALHGKLLEGDGRVQALLEQAGQGPAGRRPFWILRRLLHAVTGGRLGLSQAESFRKVQLSRLRSDPRAFTRFVYERLAALLPVAERVLGRELAPPAPGPDPHRALPSAAHPATPPTGRSPAAPPVTIKSLPPARVTQLPREPGPQEASTEPADPAARHTAARRDVEQICELLEDPDHEGWDAPGEFLTQAREQLTRLAGEHPDPPQVLEAAAQVRCLQARLEDFGKWWASQMEQEDEARWSPLLTRELAGLEEAPSGQLECVLRRRCCHAYLHCQDPELFDAPTDAGREAPRPEAPSPSVNAPDQHLPASEESASENESPQGAALSFFPAPRRDIPAEYGF